MNLGKRITGTVLDPRPTFAALAERPAWLDVFVILLIAVVAFSVLVAPYSKKDTIQMLQESTKLRERMGEQAFQAQIQRLEQGPRVQVFQGVVSPAIFQAVSIFIGALFVLIFGRLVSTQGTYKQVLSAFVHAALVDRVIGNAVRCGLIFARKSVFQTSTGLALLAPNLPVTSPLYMVLAQVDLFQLWMFGILAYGVAAIFKVDLKKALFVSYGFWLLKAIVNVGIGLFFRSFMG